MDVEVAADEERELLDNPAAVEKELDKDGRDEELLVTSAAAGTEVGVETETADEDDEVLVPPAAAELELVTVKEDDELLGTPAATKLELDNPDDDDELLVAPTVVVDGLEGGEPTKAAS